VNQNSRKTATIPLTISRQTTGVFFREPGL
jgi:hypothetical protein